MEHTKLIFIVDDEVELTQLLTLRMEACGYEVSAFNDPLALLDTLIHRTPDLFIVDLMMPGIDGLELCKRIRAVSQFQSIPILMLTACYGQKERARGYECGIDDFMNKPYDARELETRVKNLLDKKRMHQKALEEERLLTLQQTAVTVSHEMMTPLTALSLSIDQVRRFGARLPDNPIEDDLDIITQALSEMEELIYKLQRVTGVATESYIGEVSMIDLNASSAC